MKKASSLVLILVLCLVLCACSNNSLSREETAIVGEWTEVHDPNASAFDVFVFTDSGRGYTGKMRAFSSGDFSHDPAYPITWEVFEEYLIIYYEYGDKNAVDRYTISGNTLLDEYGDAAYTKNTVD